MSQSLWESEVAEEAQQQQRDAESVAEPVAETVAEPSALAFSTDDFSALEERVQRAVDLVKRERQARAAAEERANAAEAQLREQAPLAERLANELGTLRAERDHVRQRVERLLAQLDTLEL
ncbi:MAG: hypothetical protein ABSE51_23440 [Terracidiphilus sp.]